MNWLDFFQTIPTTCKIPFGRAIHADISPNEEELFNKSYEEFEKNNILDAYEYFLKSLFNYDEDINNKNILIHKTPDKLEFEIFQGSAKVEAIVTKTSLYAEVIIVRSEHSPIALKRYILERNYQLTYVNYVSDNQFIKLKLYLDNIRLTPQKIFFPLRELALNADFDKEHIRSEFSNIILEDTQHLQTINDKELKIKYDYLQKTIQELETKALSLPSNDNSGMESFLYLNALFKIDYLLSPKYTIAQELSQKVQEYFSNENTNIEAKNDELKLYILTLKEMCYTDFSSNFYTAKYTFDVIEKSPYDEIINFINESQTKLRWYKHNRYPQIISTIYTYIAFYTLYNYGMNPILRKLFHTLVEIQNADFLDSLGCSHLYDTKNKIFSKHTILSKLQSITKEAQVTYKSFVIESDDLNFSSMNEFSNSYYNILKSLNFEEI